MRGEHFLQHYFRQKRVLKDMKENVIYRRQRGQELLAILKLIRKREIKQYEKEREKAKKSSYSWYKWLFKKK
jgi:hypothetical protein